MPTERVYVVDRVEDIVAVLVDDSGNVVDVEIAMLPDVREGVVLRVQVENDHPLWETASRDPQESARQQEEARQIAERLRERDPGGDIVL